MSRWACLLFLTAPSCTQPELTVLTYSENGYSFSAEDRSLITTVASAALAELRPLLPALPPQVRLEVHVGSNVIPETGETGTWARPNQVDWTVDPRHPGGVRAVAQAQLRATLFHELHHLVRAQSQRSSSLLDEVINEGLATAFERDFAHAAAPWGDDKNDDVDAWTQELLALPPDTDPKPWLFRHPDGRRWIGYKVGTRLVDQAVRASGQSPAALVTTPTSAVLELAASARRATTSSRRD